MLFNLKNFAASFAVVSTGCMALATGTAASAEELTTIRVMNAPIADSAAIMLGEQNGIMAKHGIKLERVPTQSGAASVAAVVSGSADLSGSALAPLITASVRGLPIRLIGPQSSSTFEDPDYLAVMAREDSGITSFADLAGKTVATNALRNFIELVDRLAVEDAGADPNAIKFIELGFPEMQLALERGAVDAITLVEPFVTRAQNAGLKVVGYPNRALGNGAIVGAYYTSEAFIKANPELAARLADAIIESQIYAAAHPDEVRAVLPTYTRLKDDDVKNMVLPRYADALDLDGIKATAEAMIETGMIENLPDLDALIYRK